METRANYISVGLVSMLVISGVFVFLYWMLRFDEALDDRISLYVVFEDSVTGLNVGNKVLYNGLEVGRVKQLGVDPVNPFRIRARIEVKRGLPLRNDTVARLEHQGLTGIANVQLRGGALNAPLLFAEGKGIATIVAEKSFFSSFVGLSESLLARLSLILDDVHSLINKNENAVTRNVENIGIFTANLASNTEKIPLLFENISTLVKRLDSMSSNLDDLIVGIKPLASKNSVSLLGNVNLLLENVNILLSENRERLGETMVHFDEFSDFLVSSSDNIKDMILNVGDAANKIGQVSTHFGSLVVRLDKILDRDGGKFFYEAQLAIENFRDFSENMGLSAQLINEQLSQLTGNNFNKLNVLFAKGQDALQDVQGVVERFDRHPLRFFSGTPEIREYSYE